MRVAYLICMSVVSLVLIIRLVDAGYELRHNRLRMTNLGHICSMAACAIAIYLSLTGDEDAIDAMAVPAVYAMLLVLIGVAVR